MTQSSSEALRPRLSHPLSGADLKTLITVLNRYGPVRRDRLPFMALAVGSAIGRLPFSVIEGAYVAARRRAAPPPVFIVGHWRSGTTHLYNVMSRSDDFGFVSPFAAALPWDFLILGRVLRPLLEKALPEHRYIDRIPVHGNSPQEDEIAIANMAPFSYYHALYFPKHFDEIFNRGIFFDGCTQAEVDVWSRRLRYYYDKLSIESGGRPLLIKNPAHTACVGLLKAMWPGAKFIHIHRNPYKVFVSMRSFYKTLFRELALQDGGGVDIDEVIFKTYERMMAALSKDTALLAPEDFVEIRFDDFQRAPLGELDKIYRQLGLQGFAAARPAFEAYLDSVKGYRKNVHPFPADLAAKIKTRWGSFIERWGYEATA